MPKLTRIIYRQGHPACPLPTVPLAAEWTACGNGIWKCVLPAVTAAAAARLIPSLSVPSGADPAFRFACGGTILDSVGPDDLAPEGTWTEDPNWDFFAVEPGLHTLTLFIKTPEPAALSLLLAVTAVEDAATAAAAPRAQAALPFPVPAISQFAFDPVIGKRICSPVSTAMAVAALTRRAPATEHIVGDAYAAYRDAYGLWPRAVRAAARAGVGGIVTAIRDWGEAAQLLNAGCPIVASITYGDGELAGADVAMTAGHLLVLTGIGDGRVTVNDPAAGDAAGVRRSYDAAEFGRAWLEKKRGTAYVFFA